MCPPSVRARSRDNALTPEVAGAKGAPSAGRRPWYQQPVAQAVGIFLLVRVLGIAVLSLLAGYHDRSLDELLDVWDGQWYLAIAEHGYAGVPDSLVDAAGQHHSTTALAFFPAYPTVVRLLAGITGLGMLPSAVIVSSLAGIAAAVALHRIGRSVGGPRTGLILVALWAGAPMAITLSMAYTEAMFTALAAWALVGVLERNWLLAGLCCLAAGLVRPTASVLVAVVGAAALVAAFRYAGQRLPALACAVLCPLGLLGYWTYVAARTGSPTGWFDLERDGWATRFDGGRETVEFVGDVLATGPSAMETITVLVLLGSVVLVVLAAINRLPWPLVAYAAGVVVLVAGSAGLPFVKARFLLPGFALLLPIALGLANRRGSTAIAGTAGIVLLGSWFSAYALTGWEFAI